MSKINENQVKISANDSLRHYNGTEQYYKYKMGLMLTDGSKALADKYSAWWLLDVIMSHQPRLAGEEFQQWKLEKNGETKAIVSCDDGNGKVILKQTITYTDFEADTATLWVENKVIMLPSER
jgi:hypothetical protein